MESTGKRTIIYRKKSILYEHFNQSSSQVLLHEPTFQNTLFEKKIKIFKISNLNTIK